MQEELCNDLDQLNSRIIGVEFKPLVTHADDRGFFREILRVTDSIFNLEFAQWSHSRMTQNTVKAWHYHHTQTDWWYIASGCLITVLIDKREESPTYNNKLTFSLGPEGQLMSVVRIPPGVMHGLKVLSPTADMLYITSKTYDPKDEGRFPFNHAEFGINWGNESELIIAENDRKVFLPASDRAQMQL